MLHHNYTSVFHGHNQSNVHRLFFVENDAELWRGLCYFISALKFFSTEGNLHLNKYVVQNGMCLI